MKTKVNLFWFRRDLRINDNVGLTEALNSEFPVLPIFIFDSAILEKLPNRQDRRVDYIQQSIMFLNDELKTFQSGIRVLHGSVSAAFEQLLNEFDIQEVFCNRDYEPIAIQRDLEISKLLKKHSISLSSYKDQVIFEHFEVVKADNTPYTVFTPFAKKWKSRLIDSDIFPRNGDFSRLLKMEKQTVLSLEEIGFLKTTICFVKPILNEENIIAYKENRDFPALDLTTHIGVALRFGTLSIRECVSKALELNETWLNELIWREFFMQLLFHFPHVVNSSFRKKYDVIEWRNNEEDFKQWCEGKTGYPIVDAGIQELLHTGFMHNRVRMICASFLCKHLLIDWRWGEAFFAEHLLDYDLSANNGNWQWAAGCGADAAPYFRVFNPTRQMQTFDKEFVYVKKWNPDYLDLPPMIEHEFARKRAIDTYKEALNNNPI